MQIFSAAYPSPLGRLILESDGKSLCGLYFAPHFEPRESCASPATAGILAAQIAQKSSATPSPAKIPAAKAPAMPRPASLEIPAAARPKAPAAAHEMANLPIFLATKIWLDAYFALKNPPIARLALAPRGSDFARLVWEALCDVPFGATTTYGELAQKVAQKISRQNATKISARAVGRALSRNPIALIIPCHRVVMKGGKLGGYAHGVSLKARILAFEGAKIPCATRI